MKTSLTQGAERQNPSLPTKSLFSRKLLDAPPGEPSAQASAGIATQFSVADDMWASMESSRATCALALDRIGGAAFGM
jgi:hypothetical protein